MNGSCLVLAALVAISNDRPRRDQSRLWVRKSRTRINSVTLSTQTDSMKMVMRCATALAAAFLFLQGAAHAACSVVRLESSGRAGIRIWNEADKPIYVYAVDDSGKRTLLRVVIPNLDFDASYAAVQAAWIIATADDRCVAVYRVNQALNVTVTRSLLDQAGSMPRIEALALNVTSSARIGQSSSDPAPQGPELVGPTDSEKYSRRERRACEALATQCVERADRDYAWYMSFFHQGRIDPRDYRAEQSRANRERKESIEVCMADRKECLNRITDDD